MTPVERFISVLSRLDIINQALNRLSFVWNDEAPLSLEFAVIGRVLADRGLELQPDERQLVRFVLACASELPDETLRNLVQQALIPTMMARASRRGAAHRQVIEATFFAWPAENPSVN